jgi:hypothetical protein
MLDESMEAQELADLVSMCSGAPVVLREGGFRFVRLPGLRFTSRGIVHEMEALLVPQTVPTLGGYTSRLLLERRTPAQLNWATVTALGRPWETWSWNNVPSNWPWREILASHLKALA